MAETNAIPEMFAVRSRPRRGVKVWRFDTGELVNLPGRADSETIKASLGEKTTWSPDAIEAAVIAVDRHLQAWQLAHSRC